MVPKGDEEEALVEVTKVCEVRATLAEHYNCLMVVLSSDHRFILRRQEEF